MTRPSAVSAQQGSQLLLPYLTVVPQMHHYAAAAAACWEPPELAEVQDEAAESAGWLLLDLGGVTEQVECH